MSSKKITDILLYFSLAIFLFGSGYKLGEFQTRTDLRNNLFMASGGNRAANLDFNLFWDTWDKVEEKYIDQKKVDREKMFYGAIKGVVASLEDPYTFFLTPEENQQSKDDLGGKFEGIGAQLGLRENKIVVIAPLKNSPAEKVGVRTGDFVTKVDGASTRGWTLPQAVSKIRGKEGTSVKLTLERNDKEFDVSINRQQILVSSVETTYETQNGDKVAYLKLNQFGENTNEEWDTAVEDIAKRWKSGEIKGMVLDVRDNPGGYLDGAVYTASEFIENGKLVVKQESTQGMNREYKVQRQGRLLDIPMTVLINGGSASASEILAGALRDHKRATIIGEKSFGKGSVQEALDLKGGAGLHVTIAKWILPNGDWINGKGIEPEIKVANEVVEGNTLTKETDAQLNKAIERVLQ